MADRHAMAGLESGEVPALHAAGEPLALARGSHVNLLSHHEMRGREGRANIKHGVLGHTELDQPLLRFNLHPGKMSAVRLRDILYLGGAAAELDRDIVVTLLRTDIDDLQVIKMEDSDGHMRAVVLEDPGHTQLLCNQSGAHRLDLRV